MLRLNHYRLGAFNCQFKWGGGGSGLTILRYGDCYTAISPEVAL